MSKKRKNNKAPETGRLEERMWRIHQRAVTIPDARKAASKKACRKGGWN